MDSTKKLCEDVATVMQGSCKEAYVGCSPFEQELDSTYKTKGIKGKESQRRERQQTVAIKNLNQVLEFLKDTKYDGSSQYTGD